MRLLILGSGAGGGVPQWNAFNANGRAAFSGDPLVPFRSQCSIAASADGQRFTVFNASPDLRQQILATPALHPRIAPRSSPIAAVVLSGAEIDQVTGLLSLRERQAFRLFGSPSTLEALAHNPIFEALRPDVVTQIGFVPDEVFAPCEGLKVTAIDLPGKAPLYLEEQRGNPLEARSGDCTAFVLDDGGGHVVFAPGCARMTPRLAEVCDGAALVLFDGTLFTDDEMIVSGEGTKTAQRMGHMPMTGPGSALEAFQGLKIARKMFIHINNTNPVVRLDAPERHALWAAGWEIAEDGMEISV